MKKLLSAILGGMMLSALAIAPSFQAKAEEMESPEAAIEMNAESGMSAEIPLEMPAAEVEISADADQSGDTATTASSTDSSEDSSADQTGDREITFADGKTGEIHDGHVYITRFGGLRMAPADGKYDLSDGSSILVKSGMLVSEDEAPEAYPTIETEPAAGNPDVAWPPAGAAEMEGEAASDAEAHMGAE